jgi:hypothetical protein
VCLLRRIPIGILAAFGHEDVDVTIPLATCTTDTLKLSMSAPYSAGYLIRTSLMDCLGMS